MTIEGWLFYIFCFILGTGFEMAASYISAQDNGLFFGLIAGLLTFPISVAVVWSLGLISKTNWYDWTTWFLNGLAIIAILIFVLLGRTDVALSFTGTQLIALPIWFLGGQFNGLFWLFIGLGIAGYSTLVLLTILGLYGLYEGSLILFRLVS
jgi:hypothetical protein